MSEVEKITEFMEQVKKDLIANYKNMGLPASGKWGRSLNYEVSETDKGYSAIITGQNYTYWLENGRGKNLKQDPKSLRKWVGWAGNSFLKQWVHDKNINVNPFAVAYKIAREGIKVPNKFNRCGLVSDVVTIDRINELIKSLGQSFKINTQSTIIKEFK